MNVGVAGDALAFDTDCHSMYLPYADGASFAGYRARPWPVPGVPGANLTFRGIKNLDAAVAWALEHGLAEATELVVTGVSAGGHALGLTVRDRLVVF